MKIASNEVGGGAPGNKSCMGWGAEVAPRAFVLAGLVLSLFDRSDDTPGSLWACECDRVGLVQVPLAFLLPLAPGIISPPVVNSGF